MKLYDKDGNELNLDVSAKMFRDAAKDGMHDWMEEKYATVGKWTLGCIAFFAFGAIIALIVWATGLVPGK